MRRYEPIVFPDFITKTPLTGDYVELTAKQAAAFFNWHQEIMPVRIDYMLSYCSEECGVPAEKLRRFPEGFLDIWMWFKKHQTLRDSTPDEIRDMEQKFGYLGESWVPKRVLDDHTERLHHDIGMFLGYQFVEHYPNNLKWSYYLKPKSDIFVKSPVILGFKRFCKKDGSIGCNVADPVHLVGSESRLVFENQMSDTSLYELCKTLMTYVIDINSGKIVEPAG